MSAELIGDVVYLPGGFEAMRRLHELTVGNEDEAEVQQVLHEALILHEFHQVFPGLLVRDPG